MGRSDTKVPPYRSMGRPTSPHSTPQKRMALRTPQLPHTSMGHPKPHDPTLLIYGAATPPSSAPHIYEALRPTDLTLQIYWAPTTPCSAPHIYGAPQILPHNPTLHPALLWDAQPSKSNPTDLWGAPNPAPQPHIASHTSMSCSDPQTPPHTFPSCPIETNGAQNPTTAPHIDGAPLMLPHSPRFRPTHLWGTQSFRSGATPQISGAAPPSSPPSPRAAVLPAMRSTLRLKPRPFRFIAPPLPPERAAASAVQHIPQRCHFRRTALPLPPYWPPYRASTSAVGLPPCVCCTARPFPPYSTATSGLYSALQNRHFLRTAPPLPPYILLFSTPTSALEIPLSSLDFRCTLPSSPAPSAPSRTTTSAF